MDGEQEHKFQSAHQLYLSKRRPFRDNLDIPPRKLLSHRLVSFSSEPSMDIYQYHHLNDNNNSHSPRFLSADETLFQKFLPRNSDESDLDPYACDQFRMFEFKIRKCTRSKSHDWTDCPFAHPGEKARRRCPRRFNYSGTVCPDFRRGSCERGDGCEFAHGIFESWLHPSRYRTEPCKDGLTCQRKVCFFAHTPGQLRSPPPENVNVNVNVSSPKKKVINSGHYGCYHSPTSIFEMEKLSPPSSPPFSPAVAGFSSPVSRFSDRLARTESSGSYKDSNINGLMTRQAIKELMNSMNAMNLKKEIIDHAPNKDPYSLFAFSPPTQSPLASRSSRSMINFNESTRVTAGGTPDLDWVNDLLT